jgi:two-component system cell cycle response regulator DivK
MVGKKRRASRTNKRPTHQPPHDSSAAPRRPSVLIVDDGDDSRSIYAMMLDDAGMTVLQAVNGQEGVDRAIAEHPDAIVMDMTMPVMDGWEAVARLHANRGTRTIPVIALTGGGFEAYTRAMEAGCRAFLLKPCLPQDLLGVLTATIPRRLMQSARARHSS